MTDETKHTPGQWEARPGRESRAKRFGWVEVWGPDRTPVVDASGVDVTRDGETWTEYGVRISPMNVALIVAAPEMLDVLRFAVSKIAAATHEIDCPCDLCKIEDAARAVIAKAEGGLK